MKRMNGFRKIWLGSFALLSSYSVFAMQQQNKNGVNPLSAEAVHSRREGSSATPAPTKIIMYRGNRWQGAQQFNHQIMSMLVREQARTLGIALREKGGLEVGISVQDLYSAMQGLKDPNHPVGQEVDRLVNMIEQAAETGIRNYHIFTFGEGSAICAMMSNVLDEKYGDSNESPTADTRSTSVTFARKSLCARRKSSFFGASSASVQNSNSSSVIEDTLPAVIDPSSKNSCWPTVRLGSRFVSVISLRGERERLAMDRLKSTFATHNSPLLPFMEGSFLSSQPMRKSISLASNSLEDEFLNASFLRSFEAFRDPERRGRIGSGLLKDMTIYIHVFGSDYATEDGQKIAFDLDTVSVEHYLDASVALEEGIIPPTEKVGGKCGACWSSCWKTCTDCCEEVEEWWGNLPEEDRERYKNYAILAVKTAITAALMAVGVPVPF